MSPAGLEDLARRFAAGTIPQAEWTHAGHLAVGAWHVHHHGADEALVRLRTGIRSLNERHGTPNSETRGYHETVTRAYVRLVAHFLASPSPAPSLAERVERLLASPLAAKDALLVHYSRERLFSVEARLGWIEPDLTPLP